MRQFPALIAVIVLASLSGRLTHAEEMTPEKGMEMWAFMEGNWTVHNRNGAAMDYTCKRVDDASCYVIEMTGFRGIVAYDAAKKKSVVSGSHAGGLYSTGLWSQPKPNVVEGTFTVTLADGTKETHTGRFDVVGENEFTYAIDGEHFARMKRKQAAPE
jgi:hypothetical protein